MSKNIVSNSKIGKSISQTDETGDAENLVKDSEAESLSQVTRGSEKRLKLGKFGEAVGKEAIWALVIVFIIYLIFQYL